MALAISLTARYAINVTLFAGMLTTHSVYQSNAVCVAACSFYDAASIGRGAELVSA
jgi:hypothetical protein